MSKAMRKPVTWWECEPRRLERDQDEIGYLCPNLHWTAEGAGRWEGHLPMWPFDRPQPRHLQDLIGPKGLLVLIRYGHAYPMVPPAIVPIDPKPELEQRLHTRFHVMGDGSLCLFQNNSSWTGRGSILDLIRKAAGWRVEYALIKLGVIEAMTINSIVADASRDALIEQVPKLERRQERDA
ncbi:hypothetical protein [Amycolatopsis sp. NPDC059657]|uniref:hypothetical protein n=1 Tax=Amycolatopsis sp. NPDC059657 TaxID=3346899 RepID=UPI00366E9752